MLDEIPYRCSKKRKALGNNRAGRIRGSNEGDGEQEK